MTAIEKERATHDVVERALAARIQKLEEGLRVILDLCDQFIEDTDFAPIVGVARSLLPHQCHAGSDGDCSWGECPQKRDDEPRRSGRHCPLDVRDEDR